MADTIQTQATLLSEFADNLTGNITAQFGRNLIVSAFGYVATRPPNALDDNANNNGTGAFFDTGSRWFDKSQGVLYECVSGAPFTAVWGLCHGTVGSYDGGPPTLAYPTINFIDGSGIFMTVAGNNLTNRLDVTVHVIAAIFAPVALTPGKVPVAVAANEIGDGPMTVSGVNVTAAGSFTATTGLNGATVAASGLGSFGSLDVAGSATLNGVANTGDVGSTTVTASGLGSFGSMDVSGASTLHGVSNTGDVGSTTVTASGLGSFGSMDVSGASTLHGVSNTGDVGSTTVTASGLGSFGSMDVSGASNTNGITDTGGISTTTLTTTGLAAVQSLSVGGVPYAPGATGAIWFGDGTDGAVTFDGVAVVLGMVPNANVYTMTRDIFCTNITINAGITLRTNNFRVFCESVFHNLGTVNASGTNGNNGAAGAAGVGGFGGASVPGTYSDAFSIAGGVGGLNSQGFTGLSNTPVVGYGPAGGNGGPAAPFPGGAGGVAATTPPVALGSIHAIPQLMLPFPPGSATPWWIGGASGGGGSSSVNTAGGGGGGGGGGTVFIAAGTLNNGAGVIEANGGNGGNGGGTAGNAGGGGGGSGGWVALVYSALTLGTVTVTAGTGGTGFGTGGAGVNGSNGTIVKIGV
jgi:hypothetical protein